MLDFLTALLIIAGCCYWAAHDKRKRRGLKVYYGKRLGNGFWMGFRL